MQDVTGAAAGDDEHLLSVPEAILEAMNTPFAPNIQTPRDLPAPEPHLPLRKASAQRLQQQSHARRGAPKPLFAPEEHQVRGFNPSPVKPLPHIDNITASSEHAFAGRDERVRRPFRMPVGMQAMGYEQKPRQQHAVRPETSHTNQENARPPSSPMMPPSPSQASLNGKTRKLRPSRSLGEGLRGLRRRITSKEHGKMSDGRGTPDSPRSSPVPELPNGEMRQSMRSALTSSSSMAYASTANTDRSSQVTGHSSRSDFVEVYPNWPGMDQQAKGSFDVDDMIGMYEDGFESAKPSMEAPRRSLDMPRASRDMPMPKRSFTEIRPSSAQSHRASSVPKRPTMMHRRSQSAGLLDRVKPALESSLAQPQTVPQRDSTAIATGQGMRYSEDSRSVAQPAAPVAVPRDGYGFKKVSHYITLEKYDEWDRTYSEHVDRRRKKWQALMKSYGLSTDKPIRFPPKSDKVKRYVRKGVPPEWRGAAWFWYAGGPGVLAKQPGLYNRLLQQVEQGQLSDNDREHIERDLNRTFPDNVRFKPDPTTTLDAQAGAGGGNDATKKKRKSAEPEVPIVRALRRVLQAFAVHNPQIGYCQSLNFIAGLLLLFLDSDEEKAFILLNQVTTTHLPGTHGVTLEGANIDIAVLMSCIKDSMPAIWAKLDDKGGIAADETAAALRLPTVSLATTAWFMSLFVGTLPIESVLRVWDCLFFEGSKTLFRIALAIFKAGEKSIVSVNDPMEIFQVVQTIPRSMLDINGLMEVCFRRRGGFGHVSQDLVERRREERRREVKEGVKARVGMAGELDRLKGRWRSRTKA